MKNSTKEKEIKGQKTLAKSTAKLLCAVQVHIGAGELCALFHGRKRGGDGIGRRCI